jgi:pilus assembly protein CpaF
MNSGFQFTDLSRPEVTRSVSDVVNDLIAKATRSVSEKFGDDVPRIRQGGVIAEQARQLVSSIVEDEYQRWAANPGGRAWPKEKTVADLAREIFNVIYGLGPIEVLLEREDIEDLAINGSGEVVVTTTGQGWQPLPHNLLTDVGLSDQMLQDMFNNYIEVTGLQVGERSPIVDAVLPLSGHRLSIVSKPVAHRDWPLVVIRRHRDVRFSPQDYLQNPIPERTVAGKQVPDYLEGFKYGAFLTPAAMTFLHMAVLSTMNLCVIGRTGVGKTAFISMLGSLIPTDRRVLVLEDTPELNFRVSGHPENTVYIQSIEHRMEGSLTVPMSQLVKVALRQRPDHLIMGEARGAEMWDLIQAMSTGHGGMITSVHATGAEDMIGRVEYMISLAEVPLSFDQRGIANLISNNFHVAIHLLQNMQTKRRYVNEIAVFRGRLPEDVPTDRPNMQTIFKGGPENDYYLRLVADECALESLFRHAGQSFETVRQVYQQERAVLKGQGIMMPKER